MALLQERSHPGHVLSARDEVAAVSNTLGAPVTVARNLEKNFVYVEPHGAPPLEILRSVASALHASVLQDQAGYRIERTKQDLEALRSHRSQERAEWLRKNIDRRYVHPELSGVRKATSAFQELSGCNSA